MANNEEQNIVDKAKDVAKAATETSKLAANLASGNLIGAAKNAFNLLKDKNFKKKLKRKIIKIVLISMIPIIIALSFFAVLNTMKDTMIDLLSNAGTAISGFLSKAWQWMTDDYWIELDEEIEYEVEGENGETTSESYTIVEKYIKELGNQGISLKELRLLGEGDYSNEEALLENEDNKELIEKYIAEFIRADIITQQPHRRRGSELVNPNNQNQIDGGVYFYRPIKQTSISDSELNSGLQSGQELDIEDKEYKQMTYLDSEEFIQKANNNDPNIKYNFSIDKDTGELLIAEIKTTSLIEKPLSTAEGEWFTDIEAWVNGYSLEASTTYEVTVKREDYKKYISKYTMPYEFLINLCEITQNPEFVYHVALLARDTKIILGVQDNTTVERETIEVETDYYDYINYKNNYTREATSSNKKLIKTRKVTTTTTETPVLTIQYADTWSFYEDKEYKKTTNVDTTQTDPKVEDIRKETLSGYNEPVYAYENHSVGSKVSEEAYQSFTDDAKIGFERVQEEPEYWYENNMASEERTATQMVTKTLTYNEEVGSGKSVEKSKQFLGLLRNTTGKCKYDCFPSGILGNVVNDVTQDYMPTAMFCSKHAEFDRNGTNVQYRIPNTTKTESPLNKLLSGLDMLYAVLQSNSSGYDEADKLLKEDEDSLKKQDEYIAQEDYESVYVVKMQGLVEHLQYLMTFPENEVYSIKDIILENLFGGSNGGYHSGFGYGFWWPVNAENSPISSPFGMRVHPVTGVYTNHNGIDIAVPTGTEVIATADGTVTYVGTNPNEAAGLWIQIDHGNGIVSKYLHLSEIKVSTGQVVSQGEVIALSGNTGRSTGPHLHFGISVGGSYVDPLLYVSELNRRPEKVEVGENVADWRIYIETAFSELGYTMTEDKVRRILTQISTESSGNQKILQGITDINSGAPITFNNGICPWCPTSSGSSCNNTNIGHGLLQFIPTTFEGCKLQGYGDIFNGYHQICALIVNAEEKGGGNYSHIGNGTGWGPY